MVIRVRRTGNEDDRQVLGMGAPQCVDGRKCSDAEGHDGTGCPSGPRIALCGKAAIQLVTAINLFEPVLSKKLIEENEVIITRHREMMRDADLRQSFCEITTDSRAHGDLRSFSWVSIMS